MPLAANEIMSPTFEDIILLQVISSIDARLPQHIREIYSHKIDQNLRPMDFKADTFVKIDKFKKEIEEKDQLSTMTTDLSLSTLNSRGGWKDVAVYSQGAWRVG